MWKSARDLGTASQYFIKLCIQAFNLRQSSNTLSNYMHSCDEVSKLTLSLKAAVSVLSPILQASWRGSCKATPLIMPSCVANKLHFVILFNTDVALLTN